MLTVPLMDQVVVSWYWNSHTSVTLECEMLVLVSMSQWPGWRCRYGLTATGAASKATWPRPWPWVLSAGQPLKKTRIFGFLGAFRKNCQKRLLASGTAVAQWLRCYATNRKVAGSIPDGVIGIFHWHNPSNRTMALGLTHPLTEMSTRRISWE